MPRIVCIVEGDGEVNSVPILLRRIADASGASGRIEVPRPIRVSACRLVRDGELERTMELGARKAGGCGGVLVLLDSDDRCPAEFGPRLRKRLAVARPDVPSALVLACREFEAWLIGAADSLQGCRGLGEFVDAPSAPESIRGCKEWLSGHMPWGRNYSPVEDQAAMTARFDLDASAGRCPSFARCRREVLRLLGALGVLPEPGSAVGGVVG